MSTTDGTQVVHEKEASLVPDSKAGKSTGEELRERRQAVEQEREKREQPRKDFLRGKGGKASDHFEIISNGETTERFSDQTGAPQSTEELSESARERWLRTGELPAKDSKEAEKPAGEGAKDDEKSGEKPGEKEKPAASAMDSGDWDWSTPEHAKAVGEVSARLQRDMKAQPDFEELNAASAKIKMPAPLMGFLQHALAEVPNPANVMRVLVKNPAVVREMAADFLLSEGDGKHRVAVLKAIRDVVHLAGKEGKAGGGGNGAGGAMDRKLTRAGRPPIEAGGASSSPSDDGSSDAAWKRKDLSPEARGELYRERKNDEEVAARRKKYGRR
jgi:hypothetical protein